MKENRIAELKDAIKKAEKEKHILERELNAEKLPQYVGKYFKNKNGREFYKICRYDAENKNLECWYFCTTNDWNHNDYYEAEYLFITHYSSLQDKIEITQEEYLSELDKYLDAIKQSLTIGG